MNDPSEQRRPFQRPNFQLTTTNIGQNERETICCLPDLIRFNALQNPHHVFCLQSQTSVLPGATLAITSITYLELAYAVESCCIWILSNVHDTFEAQLDSDGFVRKARPIALFMESDIGLFIYLAALLTLNIPCLLLSIRLSPAATCSLLSETSTSCIVVSPRMLSNAQNALFVDSVKEKPAAQILTAPLYKKLLGFSKENDGKLGRLAACRQFINESDRHVFILHSSGTTGLPKAIPLAHRNLLGYAACHSFPPDSDEYSKGINLSTLPLYHGFGVLGPCLSLSVGKTLCLPPSSTIPTGSLVLTLLRSQQMNSMMTVPAIMEEIAVSEKFSSSVQELSRLDFVAVGGGNLRPSVAEKMNAHGVKLLNHFGATELGALAPIFRPEADYDYRYLRLRTDLGLRLQFLDEDLDHRINKSRLCKLLGFPFAWNEVFELQDLLETNPLTSKSEVKILGRNDDVVVLGTGEKVLPNILERKVEMCPMIKRAVVVGAGQFQIGLMIEPANPEDNHDTLVRAIWPLVIEANLMMDGHARITTKAAIFVKPVGKHIPLSDKGSVQRREAYVTFEEEIEKLYQNMDLEGKDESVVALDISDPANVIRDIVYSCLPSHVQNAGFKDEDDLIILGMDSLQAIRLRRALNISLHKSSDAACNIDLPVDFIYLHPSIKKLSTALLELGNYPPKIEIDRRRDMLQMVANYWKSGNCQTWVVSDAVVLLTGATGNLGSHLLESLCANGRVKEIICLSRLPQMSEDIPFQDVLSSRQRQILEGKGIFLSEIAWSKIKVLQWGSSSAYLGLQPSIYENLVDKVTHIFHGAWPMDFNRKLSSFKPQIETASQLIDLAREIHRHRPSVRPRVVLASSIAVVGRHASPSPVPEKVPDDPDISVPMGYAEAKWVCEKIFENAFEELGYEVEPMIVRIGQVSGSRRNGFWSTEEHLPALVKISQTIGMMPDLRGDLSWLPVDLAAKAVSDLLFAPLSNQLVFHIENPVRQPWPDTLTFVEHKLGMRTKRVAFRDWISKITSIDGNKESLVRFFEDDFLRLACGDVRLDTRQSRSASPTLRSVGAVSREIIGLYIDFWRRSGYLS